MRPKIVFTGGGSAGHVTPNLAIIETISEKWDVYYIGSLIGIEKEIIGKTNIPYYGISSGKLRRYISMENVSDIFKVGKGIWQARQLLKKIKPNLVFSKGGFVTVPVVIAAKSLGIPVFLHESDLTPGLANKIAMPFTSKIFTSFKEASSYFPENKVVVSGSPIRQDLLKGNASKGKIFLGFDDWLPILTIMGGSLGSKRINEEIRNLLPNLTQRFQIVHICGKGQVDHTYINAKYRQFEYLSDELPDVLAATNLVLTRGGSNSIFEFLALKIPMLIIPLPKSQSRGDQILNAQIFYKQGFAYMLEEENLSKESLLKQLVHLQEKKDEIKTAMDRFPGGNGVDLIVQAINEQVKP